MADARRYEIRLFDRTLVEFSLVDGSFSPEVVLDEIDESASALMPCGLAPHARWRLELAGKAFHSD